MKPKNSANYIHSWKHKSCTSEVGVGDDWATIYSIESQERNKGHATELLLHMKQHYEAKGLFFGGSVALNDVMKHLYEKYDIFEYDRLDKPRPHPHQVCEAAGDS